MSGNGMGSEAGGEAVDVLVIGGGPSGSTTASLLRAQGFSVLLAERERFPRFHIGESLLPYGTPILRRLGVLEELNALCQRKWGARFMFEPSGSGKAVVFGRGLNRRRDMAFQVRRADFDQILLNAAARRGVEVREGVRVERVRFDGDRATGAVLVDEAGQRREVGARVVVDATGRDTLLGGQLGIKRRDPVLRQAALFAHFEDVDLGLGRDGGDILIVGTPAGWFWLIPLDARQTSVGMVLPGDVFASRGALSLDAFFDQLLAASPDLSRRLSKARRIRSVEAAADFSYRLERFGGDGWVTVGDAAAFLDPVFSSGVFLGMSMAERAAADVGRALNRRGRLDAADLAGYERFSRYGLDRFRRYILSFYDPAFVSIFCSEPPIEMIRRAVVSVLAGGVFRHGPRLWLGELLFFFGIDRERRLAAAGRRELPPAPARG